MGGMETTFDPFFFLGEHPMHHHLGGWVSGFRFFSGCATKDDRVYDLHVHNFSPHAGTKFPHLVDDDCKVMHPRVAAVRLPQYKTNVARISFGHDSMVFDLVSCF